MASPALRISHVVTGRANKGSRVSYLMAPDGSGLQRGVPEAVVLRRWRQRRMDGYTFGGCRLSATIWRAAAVAFPGLAQHGPIPSLGEMKTSLEMAKPELKRRHLSLPGADILHTLLLDLGADRLHELVQRHTSPSRQGKSGVPDLYLVARSTAAPDKPAFSRFVEVKKPGERVLGDQLDEIDFMQALGLPTRVLRLIER